MCGRMSALIRRSLLTQLARADAAWRRGEESTMTGLNQMACRRVMLALAAAFLMGAGSAAAQAIATLEATAGQVTVLRLGQPQATAPSMALQLNDILVTRQGRASVRFLSDGTVLRVGPESRVQIDENATERDIKLFFGRIWAHVIRWKERPTRFSSGSTIAAIRGTELSLAVESDGNETQLSVLEGHVEASTDAGKLDLEGGQVATGAKGRAPAVTLRAKPLDAVQWALYYPPVLKSGAPDSLTQRAAAKLATGSVEDAGKDIAEALKVESERRRRPRLADDHQRGDQPTRTRPSPAPRRRSPPTRSRPPRRSPCPTRSRRSSTSKRRARASRRRSSSTPPTRSPGRASRRSARRWARAAPRSRRRRRRPPWSRTSPAPRQSSASRS